jgi:DNA polymerase-3 subunit gamma/tau
MAEPAIAYRVLARKYRPTDFAELIGQEAMVRTLTNAIAAGRIAHAFILTGVRGVGKTTTARIIAKALNCVGPDGTGGPTISPCGQCEPCRAIAEDRHVDVMEMDAASRTGVEDIRELTDGVRYKPVAARFKIYIIDEVHMLSKNAWNALLKTLEEPPPDVKFVFATTEIGKVPITVLSRCQRFSLRRVPVEMLEQHYRRVAEAEDATVDGAALTLVAKAADGSVRDGLSILDQAIALGGGKVDEALVRDMLGVADRGLVFDLFEAVMRGDAAGALDRMSGLYQGGADPVMVLQDLLDLTHFLTRLKAAPNAGEGDPAAEGDRARGKALVEKLGMPVLARAWQMLLKGLAEAQAAPSPLQAAEMVLVRLAYVADLPAPAELVKALQEGGGASAAGPRPGGGNGGGMPARMAAGGEGGAVRVAAVAQPQPQARSEPAPSPAGPQPQSYREVVELFKEKAELLLRSYLYRDVHLVRFEPGKIELRPKENAQNLAGKIGQHLTEWTGTRWVVTVSREAGETTLEAQDREHAAGLRNQAAEHPLVRAVLETFPGATIEAVRELQPLAAQPEEPADGSEESEGEDGA